MTKQDMIDLLATSPEHATKLKAFKVADLQRFIEEQTDPANHSPVKSGDYVWDHAAQAKGIIVSTEKIPGRTDDVHNIEVRVTVSHRIQTHSGAVARYLP